MLLPVNFLVDCREYRDQKPVAQRGVDKIYTWGDSMCRKSQHGTQYYIFLQQCLSFITDFIMLLHCRVKMNDDCLNRVEEYSPKS